ncbi:DUF402 domain-containing protein [Nocardioides sp. SR21]|uniref:DUF402 domain-containing protein n=1 Tax=Nocardioides sp. SR21 TaxID=2919501 RepID=UPI001FAA2EE1|nr:DUF402 domain-containing protein [Nocardioides sp. SR21]
MLRPSGDPPYWPAGTEVVWREGAGPLGTGPLAVDATLPHFACTVTVVRDDADGLVAWLRCATPVMRAARADGRGKRDDPDTLFTTPLVQEHGTHAVNDQLRIAPTGQPWSVWLLLAQGSGDLAGWYVNLERPHVRDDRTLYTSDHVLDVVVSPDRTVVRKDEDELELAVAQGVFTREQAAAIESDAAAVEALVADWGPPFCDGWETYAHSRLSSP